MHLAQLNIGRFRFPTDDPRMAGFMDNLDRVNVLAERSPGFVWRYQDETGNATNTRVGDDYAVNLSVWENAEALEAFVFRTVHAQFYRRRAEWFNALDEAHMVFWWVPEGHVPSLDEAMQRLEDYRASGPGERAFGWAEVIDKERWHAQRCA